MKRHLNKTCGVGNLMKCQGFKAQFCRFKVVRRRFCPKLNLNVFDHFMDTRRYRVNPFWAIIAFYIETNHLFCRVKNIWFLYEKQYWAKMGKGCQNRLFSDYMRLPCYSWKLICFWVPCLQKQEFKYFTMIKLIVLLTHVA